MTNNKKQNTDKKYNISYMWWKVPYFTGTTNPIGKWEIVKRKEVSGDHAIMTGPENNITGVDLDFGYKLTDEQLYSNPVTKKFIESSKYFKIKSKKYLFS